MELKNRFGEFIANLRREKEISLEQLSDGLCDCSILSRFERGEREPDKLLQNRFLTRLGAVPENYENFLYYKDYCHWEKRQGIIHNILEENMTEAMRLLDAYCSEYKMSDALEQQFYLAMLAQIRRYEGSCEAELSEIFGTALQLTVPDIDTRSFHNRVLSLEELNLLLEYRYCKKQGVSLQFYEALLEYIERMERTVLAMAKIYPKAVFYYFCAWKESKESRQIRASRMLLLCDKAIELLRDANRMFYLWELFCMREELTMFLPQQLQQEDSFIRRRQECNLWRMTLEELYGEYGISIAMYEFCYLYVESENYCIEDVIRIRRKMLGLSQEKLCRGICDSRTISRLEQHLCKPHKEIVQELFERLNLSTELCRTELVTENPKAIEKYRKLRYENNNRNYDLVNELLAELKQMVSQNNDINRQVLSRNEIVNKYNCSELTRDEYVEKMKEALECTVSYEKIIVAKELYLTNEEIACVQNITLKIDKERRELRDCIHVLKQICTQINYPTNYLRMYEFIMATVSSYMGNCGEYEESDGIKKKVLSLLLKNRKIRGLHEALYGLLWNQEQYNEKCDSEYKKEKLNACIILSLLDRDQDRKSLYEKKLEKCMVQEVVPYPS